MSDAEEYLEGKLGVLVMASVIASFFLHLVYGTFGGSSILWFLPWGGSILGVAFLMFAVVFVSDLVEDKIEGGTPGAQFFKNTFGFISRLVFGLMLAFCVLAMVLWLMMAVGRFIEGRSILRGADMTTTEGERSAL